MGATDRGAQRTAHQANPGSESGPELPEEVTTTHARLERRNSHAKRYQNFAWLFCLTELLLVKQHNVPSGRRCSNHLRRQTPERSPCCPSAPAFPCPPAK